MSYSKEDYQREFLGEDAAFVHAMGEPDVSKDTSHRIPMSDYKEYSKALVRNRSEIMEAMGKLHGPRARMATVSEVQRQKAQFMTTMGLKKSHGNNWTRASKHPYDDSTKRPMGLVPVACKHGPLNVVEERGAIGPTGARVMHVDRVFLPVVKGDGSLVAMPINQYTH
jgi:hypothetical protein